MHHQVVNYLIDNPYIIVLIAVVVFIISLVFVVRRIFSLVITLIFLALCILSAYVIIYPESATGYMKQYLENEPQKKPEKKHPKTVEQQVDEAIDVVKDKYHEYKDKLFPEKKQN